VATRYPIYLVTFPNQYLAASTFMRFQEHYESPVPRFRKKPFGTEEFMDAYAKRRDDEFSYFTDWAGFNLPSWVLRPFLKGKFDPLSRKERALLGVVKGVEEPFYLIGCAAEDTGIIAHEFVHGLFFTVPEYRTDVLACIKAMRHTKPMRRMRKRLRKMGYCTAVLDDEHNAYLVTGLYKELRDKRLRKASRALKKVFKKHFGFDPNGKKGRKRIMARLHHVRFPRTY
jgi:hypothetical protein